MTIRKITNLTSGLVTLADLRTPTTFVHKATVSRPSITASNITQAAIVKSTLSTRQLVAAARFINRLVFREADAFALLDLIGITVGKSAADSIGLIDIVALRSTRGPQRAFDDVELINDFIAFVLHVNRSFADAVEVQQYINLIVAKSAGNDIVRPADSRYFDIALRKADAVIGRDTRALLVKKPFIDSTSFADALKITNRKLLRDRSIIDSYFALRAGKRISDTARIAEITRKDFGKVRSDVFAVGQTQAIKITKAVTDSATPADVNILKPVLGKSDRVIVTESRPSFFIGKGLGDNQPMTDLFGVFDGVVYTLSFQLFDAMAVTDAFARSFNVQRSLADVLLSSDTVIPQLRKLYREITDVSDVRVLLFGKAAFDSIVQNDVTRKFVGAVRSDSIEEIDARSLLIANLRQDTFSNTDVLIRQFGKGLSDQNTAADLIAKFLGVTTSNSVESADHRVVNFTAGKADTATTTERRFLTVGKPLTELISSTLPVPATAPEIPSLSSYSTLLRSTLAINALNKVEVGTASIYNTTDVSGGRLIFTGYPGARFINFAPVSSYQADGANWTYNLDVEFYGGSGVNGLETPDVGEDLVLQYSTDGGANFTTAQTLWAGADSWSSLVGANSSLVVNASVSSSASTGFIWRIVQFNYSNPGFDQYAVVRATPGNWGAATTTIALTDLVAIYDYAVATPQDRQVYIYDSVFVLNLRPRSASNAITIDDSKTFYSELQKFETIDANDLLSLSSSVKRDFDVFDNLVFISDVAGLLSGISFRFDNVTIDETSILLRGLPREDSFTIDDRFSDVVRAFRVFPEGTQPIDTPQKNYIKPAKQGQGVTKTVAGWGATISQPPDRAGDFVVIGDPSVFATTMSMQSRRSGTSLENFSFQYGKTADNLTPARVTVGGTSGFRSFNSTSTETVKFTVGKLLPRVIANEASLGSIITSGLASLYNGDNHAMSADFTIETYVYVSAASSTEITVAAIGNPSSANYYRFGISSTGRPFYDKFGLAAPEFFGGTILTDRWYHLAFTRLGDVMTCWLNGYNQGSFYAFGDVGNTQGIKILETSGIAFISQFRIIHGLALYQDNFASPRGELQNLPGTTVLLPTYDAASFITNYNATYPLTARYQIFASGSLTFSRFTPYRIDDGTTELLFIGETNIRRVSGSMLERTTFNFNLTAKAGSPYTIFTETQDGALDTASSLSVLITAPSLDRVGIFDVVNANFYVDRAANDTLIIGSRIPFRTPSSLERISFVIGKNLGDITPILDLANVFDGLVYVDAKLIRETLVIGLPDTRRVSDSDQERTSFNFSKRAKQGAVLKVVSGWGANVVGTTSSSDYVVIGDPSVFTTTTALPSRRSGTSLENVSFQYFKPADNLIPATVIPGSSIGDRLQGANRENVRFTVAPRKQETVQPYDLNSIFQTVRLVAKAGSAYAITRKTFDGLFENQSSVAVGIGAQQPDQTGVFDFYLAEFVTQRTTSDSVILGSRIPFRTPSTLERISFLVTKFFGDDQAQPDDFLQTFDGLTYRATLLSRDIQIMGSGATAANNRFLGSGENTAFDFAKSARQGAALKVVAGWGSSVVTTSSSIDRIVIGDPTALPTTNTAPSRRSGASLENFSFQYFKPADGLIGTSVTIGSSIGDRLQGANKENVSFRVTKALPITFTSTTTSTAIDVGGSGNFNVGIVNRTWQIAVNEAFNYGTGDFTVEWWSNQAASNGVQGIWRNSTGDTVFSSSFLTITQNSGRLTVTQGNGAGGNLTLTSDTTIALNTWHHYAYVKNNGTHQLYVDGTAQNNSFYWLTSNAQIGFMQVGNAGGLYSGYITNFRIVKGTAVYTSNFTPPTEPLTAIAGTQLLALFTSSGAVNVDSSPNNFTLVPTSGGPVWTSSSPLTASGTSTTTSSTINTDPIQPYDLNSIFKQVNLSAKAGSAYSITRKTIEAVAGAQSSVAVGIGSRQQDQLGFFDYPELAYDASRTTSDLVTIGYSLPFRTPNSIERISFLITKFFGDDNTPMIDAVDFADGLVYIDRKLLQDRQIMGAGATAANNRFLGSEETVIFDVAKSARQGATLKQIVSWGTSVTGTTSSGDFIVIGDPSYLAPSTARQSRRSGTTLENFKYDVAKPFATTAGYGTNLLQYSEQIAPLFGTGALVDIQAAIAAAGANYNSDYFVAPDKTISGDRIDTTGNTGTVKYDIIVSSNTTYTWSFWALKTVASGNTNLSVRDYTNSSYLIAPTDYQPSLSLSSWTRVVQTFTTPANAQSIGLNFITGSSNSIGLWGWSLEPGSSTGPYIRTTSAAIVGTGYGAGIEYNTVGVDDGFRRVIPFRRLFQEGQEAFERSFKDVYKPTAGVDSLTLAESIIVTKLLDYRFNEALGDRDPFGTVALVDRGFVRMTNYVEDIDYFAEDYTGVQRNLSNFYYPPLKVDVEDYITIADEVSFVTGQWVQRFFGPVETIGDLDPFGNINTLINRGTLRITNYVEDIDYFESDYIGESRTIS